MKHKAPHGAAAARKSRPEENAVAPAGKPPVSLYSHLYCRLNGFMLGVFVEMCQFKLARERYSFYRGRMQSLLREIGADVPIPPEFGDEGAWAGIAPRILELMSRRSPELTDFFILGTCAPAYMRLARRNRPAAEPFRRAAHDVMGRWGLSYQWFDEMQGVDAKPARTVHELVSPALALLTRCITGLRMEPKTCFIAMPFKEPFESHHAVFYRPLLAQGGYRALRAWGGFGGEDFSPLLVATVLRSGALLADITEGNPNVMWEIGVAQGAGKPVFLLSDVRHDAPSDLRKHVMLGYDPTVPDWAARSVEEFALSLSVQAAAMQRLHGDPIRVASGLRFTDVEATSNFLLDTFWEASFFSARERGESDANGHLRRGLDRIKARRWADAQSDFTYALDHGALSSVGHFGRGMARSMLRQHAAAERDFCAAIRAGLDNAEVRCFRGATRYQLRHYKAAVEDFDRVISAEPQHAQALRGRAMAFAHLGLVERCRQDCAAALRLAPEHPDAHGAQGYLHLLRAEYASAASRFRKARGRAFGKSWHFEAALAELLGGKVALAAIETEKGLMRASDADIDQALAELRILQKLVPASDDPAGQDRLAKRFRRRLLEVRTPRGW